MTMRLFRPVCISGILYPEAIIRVVTDKKVLYLTFDDGPDPGSTPGILNILGEFQIKAMFFCSGSKAEKNPMMVEKIISEGHVIGNHGYSHPDGWHTSFRAYYEDVNRASKFTSDRFFRPPYGHLTLRQYWKLQKIFRIFFWDIMAYDFDKDFGPGRSLEVLNSKIRPGSIIVLHDTPDSTCRYFLKEFIGTSLKRGYRFDVLVNE
jgi:peptidoglycan/xylan/chitin deacetylase (PgdA/CDA1 family)